MKVVLATVALLLSFGLAVFGYAISQGERDLLTPFLTMAAVLALTALGLFGWSLLEWYRRTKQSVAVGGSAEATTAVSDLSSTVLLVFGVVLAFVGLPMLIDGVSRLTRPDVQGTSYSVAELPWFFAVGLVLVVSALTWKVRLRQTRARGRAAA